MVDSELVQACINIFALATLLFVAFRQLHSLSKEKAWVKRQWTRLRPRGQS